MSETKSATTAGSLYAALAKVQAELPRVAKNKTGEVKKDGRKVYDYDYADLTDVSEAIMPLLGKNGLAFTARPTLNGNGTFVLAYSLLHSSGEREDGEYPLPPGGTPQDVGKAITYGRRYCLCAVTGVAPGGDDNDAAGVPAHKMDRGRDESWRDQPPVSRNGESRPAEHSEQADDGDWGGWRAKIDAITSQDDANRLDAELRGAFKMHKLNSAKANNIRAAIKAKADSLPKPAADAGTSPPASETHEYDPLAQRFAGEAVAAADTDALEKIHNKARSAKKLPVFVKLESPEYAGTLLSLVQARRDELEHATNGQPVGAQA